MKYRHIYRMLVNHGHTPQKAAEIILDATRKNLYSRQWIYSIFKLTHAAQCLRVKHV